MMLSITALLLVSLAAPLATRASPATLCRELEFVCDDRKAPTCSVEIPSHCEHLKIDGRAPGRIMTNAEASALGEALVKVPGQIQSVSLRGNNIGPAGATAIAKALGVPGTELKELDLTKNQLGDEGCEAIAVALRVGASNTKLTTLSMSHNEVGDDGAKALGVMLATNTKLKFVWMDNNRIGDSGAAAVGAGIANHNALRNLFLSHNKINDFGATGIGEALEVNRQLRKLEMTGNQMHSEGCVAIAKGLTSPRSKMVFLDLEQNRIGDEGANALVTMLADNKNTKLKKIKIAQNQLSSGAKSSLQKAGMAADFEYVSV